MRQLTSLSQELLSFFWLFVTAVLLCWCLADSCVFWERMSRQSVHIQGWVFLPYLYCFHSTKPNRDVLWWVALQSAQPLWELYQECWKIKNYFKKKWNEWVCPKVWRVRYLDCFKLQSLSTYPDTSGLKNDHFLLFTVRYLNHIYCK